MERDIIERLMDFESCGLTALDRVNMRECAAIEIHKLRDQNDRYRKALEIINGSADWLVSRQAAAALDNIGPPLSNEDRA
jgi:hypothetical protein